MSRKRLSGGKVSEAFRDFLLEATEEESRDAFAEAGEDFDYHAAQGRSIVERALSDADKDMSGVEDLRRGLGLFVQLLRRKKGISVDELAADARVDSLEIQCIELDPAFEANLRTIYQLEQYFKLPPRTLVLLSGAVDVEPVVREGVVRFAASAKGMDKLSREEKRELNGFVKFLREYTDR